MIEARLTTTDNPYDPFDEYDEWFAFDNRMGYHTPGFLDRILVTSSEISDVDQQLDIESAIDEIVKENVLGIYKKVIREVSIT